MSLTWRGVYSTCAPQTDADRQSMVHDLIELFDEIDVNGDQMMEWDEFTEHIVEKAVRHCFSAPLDVVI